MGVSIGARWTRAHGPVVGRSANSIGSTGSRDLAGVLALSIVADSSTRTVTVSQALVRRATLSRGVCHSARWALALVSSDGVDADGGRGTGAVLALVNIHTAVVGEDVTWLTVTLGNVVGGGAGSLATAGDTAGVHTAVVDDLANFVPTAVSVGLTLNLRATQGGAGVTDMLLVTLAERLVVLHQAVGVGPTVCSIAWVDTFPVSAAVSGAGKSIQAVTVGPAFVRALAALGVGVSHFSTGAGALEGAGGVCAG